MNQYRKESEFKNQEITDYYDTKLSHYNNIVLQNISNGSVGNLFYLEISTRNTTPDRACIERAYMAHDLDEIQSIINYFQDSFYLNDNECEIEYINVLKNGRYYSGWSKDLEFRVVR